MRQLLLAAAVQLAMRGGQPSVENPTVWDKTVCRPVMESGVMYDYRNPVVTNRTALVGEGRFGGECFRFTDSERFTVGATPFALYSDFTIEGFFNFDSLTRTNQYMCDFGTNGFILRYYSGRIVLTHSGGNVILDSGFVPTIGVWHHVALVRFGTILKIYIDGIMMAQAIWTTNMSYTTFTVGNYGGGGQYSITGRIDQFRVVQEALYTANFTPPSVPFVIGGNEAANDTNWDNVILLVDSASGGEFVDSKSALSITRVGSAAIDLTNKKIGQAGIYIPGGSSRLGVPDTGNVFDFATGNWTVECWVKPTQVNSGTTWLVGRTISGGWALSLSNMRPQLLVSNNGSSWTGTPLITGSEIQLNKWTHVAGVRFGNSFFLFVDGRLISSVILSSSLVVNNDAVSIGNIGTGTAPFTGYMDSVRITRAGRYVSDFTPKLKTPYATVSGSTGDGDPYWPKVKALLEFTKDISAGPDMFSVVLQRNDISLDSERMLFGEKTLKVLSGANGGINYSNATQTILGNADATVEGWVNTDYAGAVMLPMIGQYHATTNGSWVFGVINGKAGFYIRGGIYIESTATVADGQWHHIAMVIRSQTVYLYVDGVLQGSGAWGVVPSYNGNIQVGYNIAVEVTSGSRINLSRVRVTHGQGRYVSNFTPDENTIRLNSLAA